MEKVEGHEHLLKDPERKCVINNDKTAFEAARARKRAVLEKQKEEQEQKERIDAMEDKLDKILELLGEKNG